MALRRTRSRFFHRFTLVLLCVADLGASGVRAQTILDEVHTLAEPTTAVPVEETLAITTAGTYTLKLTDLGAALTPSAPLASVQLAVTNAADAVVGDPLIGAGTLTLNALPAGTYKLHIVGMPGNVPGSGPIGIQVNSGTTTVAAFSDALTLPSQALPNGETVLDDRFMVSTTGTNYTVTLTDLKLPQSLSQVTLLVIAQGSAVPVVTLPNGGAYQATNVALTAGVTYRIFAVAEADPAVHGGLFSAVVTGAGGSTVYGHAVPVGSTMAVDSVALGAGSATFGLTDLKYPSQLSQLGGVVTLNGQIVAQLAAQGSQAFAAVAGTYLVYASGTAPASAGSYAVQITPQGAPTPFLSVARPVVAAGSTLAPYSFDTQSLTAGMYTATLSDFGFPSTLTNVSLALVQGGKLLGTPLSATGSVDIMAASGPLSLLVFAQSAAGGGLFGVDVTPTASGSPYHVTQGVGSLFSARQISITAAGSYSVTATDLLFPAAFANYDTIVTQGSTQLGSIIGGGTFKFTAQPGNYFINFIAEPTGTQQAGTYALKIVPTPAAPVVNLTTDHTQVSSGSTVDLAWSSQNATACTASGGWSGTQALSGVATSAALTANTTFTLTCQGAGGSTAKSVTVAVTLPSGGGGGGGIDPETILVLLAGIVLRRTGGVRRGAMHSV